MDFPRNWFFGGRSSRNSNVPPAVWKRKGLAAGQTSLKTMGEVVDRRLATFRDRNIPAKNPIPHM
jgi:hypothetical protein